MTLCALTAACSKFYWLKPGASPEEFHWKENVCLQTATHNDYRQCMQDGGWARIKTPTPAPVGSYRGYPDEHGWVFRPYIKCFVAALLSVFVAVVVGWLPARAEAQDAEELFRKVAPSVVVIRAKGRAVVSKGLVTFNEIGSGVLISADGKVMTAAHVVHAMDEILVEFLGGESVPARVVASEPAADLGLVQLAHVPKGAQPAPLGDSDRVRVGQQVLVIGAPYGLSHSFSAGWISAKWLPNTAYRSMPLAEFFQTTATINTGNSGGPMFNWAGEVIGVVSHNISKGGGSEGLGFVVTMKSARYFLMDREWAWIGLEGTVVTGELAEILNVPGGSGLLVSVVPMGSPAWDMGILGGDRIATIRGQELVVRGDVVLSMAGIVIKSDADLPKIREKVGAMHTGQPFKASVLRAGRVIELTGKAP
jgi:serine protease Do